MSETTRAILIIISILCLVFMRIMEKLYDFKGEKRMLREQTILVYNIHFCYRDLVSFLPIDDETQFDIPIKYMENGLTMETCMIQLKDAERIFNELNDLFLSFCIEHPEFRLPYITEIELIRIETRTEEYDPDTDSWNILEEK